MTIRLIPQEVFYGFVLKILYRSFGLYANSYYKVFSLGLNSRITYTIQVLYKYKG